MDRSPTRLRRGRHNRNIRRSRRGGQLGRTQHNIHTSQFHTTTSLRTFRTAGHNSRRYRSQHFSRPRRGVLGTSINLRRQRRRHQKGPRQCNTSRTTTSGPKGRHRGNRRQRHCRRHRRTQSRRRFRKIRTRHTSHISLFINLRQTSLHNRHANNTPNRRSHNRRRTRFTRGQRHRRIRNRGTHTRANRRHYPGGHSCNTSRGHRRHRSQHDIRSNLFSIHSRQHSTPTFQPRRSTHSNFRSRTSRARRLRNILPRNISNPTSTHGRLSTSTSFNLLSQRTGINRQTVSHLRRHTVDTKRHTIEIFNKLTRTFKTRRLR